MKTLIGILLLAMLIASLPLEHALARGFGGFRGGGGGGFSDRGFGGGDGFGGGFSDRGFSGGWGGDRSDRGGFRQEGAQRSFEGGADRFRSDRPEISRPRDAERPDQDGNRWGKLPNRDFSGVSRSRLDSFLGMPTDAGVGHVSAVSRTHVTAGRVEGPRGGEAAFASATHVRYIPPEQRSNQAWSVRNNFNNYNVFTHDWWRNHPNAWVGPGIAASAWAGASWANASDWVGCDAPPEDYDYGSSVVYQGGNVYVEGQPAGTDAQYYDQAGSLASSGQDKKGADGDWLPLGVFGMVQGQQTAPTAIFQLAVNHDGIVRGNYYNTLTNTTLPVHGAVDKKTQRVAWTVGDNKTTVYDTGLLNLTKDQAPALVHMGKDNTREWLMVRLTSKDQQAKDS